MDIVKFFMTVGGAVVCWIGIQEHRVSSGASSEPLAVDLAEIESGKSPEGNHIKLEKHLAVYGETIYAYSQSKYDDSEPGPATGVDYAFYPVVSTEHQFVRDVSVFLQLQELEQNPAQPNPPPSLKEFAILVKTHRFKTVGEIPGELDADESRQGLVVNTIEPLADDEAKLVKQSFPGIDLDKVLILEEGRKPSSRLKSWGMIIGGALLTLGGVALYLVGLISGRSGGKGAARQDQSRKPEAGESTE